MSAVDHAAAAVHRAKAEEHWAAAERLRKLGMKQGEADALREAAQQDRLAHILETGEEPRRASA